MDVKRRTLTFSTLDDAVRDVALLRSGPYVAVGKWSLSQVCDHLADWLTFPVDGYPKPPIFVAPILWLMKVTVAKRQLDRYLRERSYPAGGVTMPQTVHPARDDKPAAERFTAAVERFVKYDGPLRASPLYGVLTKDVADQLQRVHCAHHLSFLMPRNEPAA